MNEIVIGMNDAQHRYLKKKDNLSLRGLTVDIYSVIDNINTICISKHVDAFFYANYVLYAERPTLVLIENTISERIFIC